MSRLQSTKGDLPPLFPEFARSNDFETSTGQQDAEHSPQQVHDLTYGWFGHTPDSTTSTSARSTNLAVIRWFGVLTGNGSHDALSDPFPTLSLDCGFLDRVEGQNEEDLTPLQRATRAVDGRQPSPTALEDSVLPVETNLFLNGTFSWQSTENITLLREEQILLQNFLRRISPWVCSVSSDTFCTFHH